MATGAASSIFEIIQKREAKPQVFSFEEYLGACKGNEMMYASVHSRLLKAIGEPQIVHSRDDMRLGRIFLNRKVRMYQAFSDFYGMETTVEAIVDFLTAASQGLEERKQILYLLGPVGSAKSSLAERLKELAEVHPIYVLAYQQTTGKMELVLSPLYESPLGVIPREHGPAMEEAYGIPSRYFTGLMSPWAIKRLQDDLDGDVTKFKVVELYPSRLKQIGIAKTEPGDDNNQDISALVGKVDIRMLEDYATDNPDAYSYSGALCKATQGVMEFVEMFKAPLKTLHPLLTATQEGNYMGTEPIGAMPFQGLILAHSNEQEWGEFQKNKKNEAFLDRVRKIPVKYNLRVNEEQQIYTKILNASSLSKAPIAPYSLEFLARVTVASRLVEPESSSLISKVRVYNGDNLKNEDPKAKSYHDYLEDAGLDEGMEGLSTRFAYKVLSQAFNFGDEVALDVVELAQVLKREIRELRLNKDEEKLILAFVDEQLKQWYFERLDEHVKEALVENLESFAQNRFERYFAMADAWVQDKDFQDPDTHMLLDKDKLDNRLSEIEKPAGISNPKDFRNEIVNWVLRNRPGPDKLPAWSAYEKMAKAIRKVIAKGAEDLIPVISFETKRDSETEKKQQTFLSNMKRLGYTDIQTRRLVGWYQQMNVSK